MMGYFALWASLFFLILIVGFSIMPKGKQSSVKKVFLDNEYDEQVDKLIKGDKRSYVDTTKEFLSQSKTGITFEKYIVINVVFASLAFALGFMIIGNPIGGVIFAPFGLLLPKRYIKSKRDKLIATFDKHLVMALERMISLLRTRKINNVIEDVAMAQDIDPFVRQEFAEMLVDLKSGRDVEDALYESYKRIGSSSLKLMYTQVKLDRDLGLSLSELFTSIRDSIIRGVHEKDDARMVTAQQKQTANGLLYMASSVVVLMYIFNPSMFDFFTTTPAGRAFFFAMVGWMALGQFLVRKVINS